MFFQWFSAHDWSNIAFIFKKLEHSLRTSSSLYKLFNSRYYEISSDRMEDIPRVVRRLQYGTDDFQPVIVLIMSPKLALKVVEDASLLNLKNPIWLFIDPTFHKEFWKGAYFTNLLVLVFTLSKLVNSHYRMKFYSNLANSLESIWRNK